MAGQPRTPRFLTGVAPRSVTPLSLTPREPLSEDALTQASSLAERLEAAQRHGAIEEDLPPPPAPAVCEHEGADLQRLEDAILRLRLEAARLAEVARADALEIGFAVARRILEQEVTANPEALFALVRSAVRRLGEVRRVTVRVCPEDASRLKDPQAVPGLAALTVDVVADASLGRGDVLVSSDEGSVDGSLEERLLAVHRAVMRADSEAA